MISYRIFMNCKNERTPNKKFQRNIVPFQQGRRGFNSYGPMRPVLSDNTIQGCFLGSRIVTQQCNNASARYGLRANTHVDSMTGQLMQEQNSCLINSILREGYVKIPMISCLILRYKLSRKIGYCWTSRSSRGSFQGSRVQSNEGLALKSDAVRTYHCTT